MFRFIRSQATYCFPPVFMVYVNSSFLFHLIAGFLRLFEIWKCLRSGKPDTDVSFLRCLVSNTKQPPLNETRRLGRSRGPTYCWWCEPGGLCDYGPIYDILYTRQVIKACDSLEGSFTSYQYKVLLTAHPLFNDESPVPGWEWSISGCLCPRLHGTRARRMV